MGEEKEKGAFSLALEDSVRLHDEYMRQLSLLLNGKTITLEGKDCVIEAEARRYELLVNLLEPSDNISQINLRMIYTSNVSRK